jgi:phospholipid N-methyltransferase
VSVRNTGEFYVKLDTDYANTYNLAGSAVLWSSIELGLSKKQAVEAGIITVPVRQFSDNSTITLYTDSTRELNITNIDYTLRYTQKRKRA